MEPETQAASGAAQNEPRQAEGGSKPSFEELLQSDDEYRRASDERVRKAVANRFRRGREQEALLTSLAERLGVAPDARGEPDVGALREAIEARDGRSRAAYDRLLRQAAQLKREQPDFDLRAALQDPAFGRLVARGVDAHDAYALTHRDEQLTQAMAFAAEKTRARLLDAMRAGALRPQEDALGTPAAAPPNPAHMSRAERASLRERVNMGERIVL